MRFTALFVVFLALAVCGSFAYKLRFDSFNIWGCPKEDPATSHRQAYQCDADKREAQGTSAQYCMCERDFERLAETGDHYIAYNAAQPKYLQKIVDSGNKFAWMVDDFSDFYDAGKSGTAYADFLWSEANRLYMVANNGTIPQYWVLNELSVKRWFTQAIPKYHKYAIDVVKQLRTKYKVRPIICSPSLLIKPKRFANDWKQLAKYAYVGVEAYVSSELIRKNKFNAKWLFETYSKGIASYNKAGVPRSKIVVFEEFATTPAGTKFGSGGLGDAEWARVIKLRNAAIKKLKCVGYASYGWSSYMDHTPEVREALYDAYNVGAKNLP
jgi:hypothetical protein